MRIFPFGLRCLTLCGLFLAVASVGSTALAQTNPLQFTAAVAPDTVRPGETLQYVFKVSNTGTSTLESVYVAFGVPDHTNRNAFEDTPGTQDSGFFGSIPPGQSRTVIRFVTVDTDQPATGGTAPADGTQITLNAVASNSVASATTAVSAMVKATPSFEVRLTPEDQNFVGAGSALNYAIRYGNVGSASVDSTLRLPLPDGTTFVSATDGGTLGGDGVVSWNLGEVSVGQTGVRRLSVLTDASLPAGSMVTAEAELADNADSANVAHHRVSTVIRTTPILGLTIAASPDAATPGQVVTYLFTAINHGTTALHQVGLHYSIPNHTNRSAFEDTPGTVDGATFDDIPPGQSRTVQRILTVDSADPATGTPAPPDGTIIHFDASVDCSENFSANTASDVTVEAHPAFNVTVGTDDSSTASPGGVLNETLHYGNMGTTDREVLLRVPLPTGTTFVSAGDGGDLGGDGVVQWNLGALAPGQTGIRHLGLAIDARIGAGSSVVTQAEVRDTATLASVARASGADTVRTYIPLTLTVVAVPDSTVLPGGTINYTFTATNHGATALTYPRLNYVIPNNTNRHAFEDGPGRIDSPYFEDIPPGQSRTRTVSLAIDAADASIGAPAPANGTIIHFFANASSSDGFGAAVSTDVFVESGAHPPLFTGETALGNGVYYLVFASGNPFGYYSYLTDAHYLYHFDLGYEYVFDAADGKAGVYLYDFTSRGFFYTSPAFPFPYLYDFALNTVLYYYPDPSNPGHYNTNGVRYFYRFDTHQIFTK